MAKIIKYKHHGVRVSVDEWLKGKHREHCLCYRCSFFIPEDRDKNCNIANLLYEFDVVHGCTTPVWECKKFRE